MLTINSEEETNIISTGCFYYHLNEFHFSLWCIEDLAMVMSVCGRFCMLNITFTACQRYTYCIALISSSLLMSSYRYMEAFYSIS